MKIKINNYRFDKVLKSITFLDYTNISLDGILLITNVTDNIIIYNFADSAMGGSKIGNILTLNYNTSLMDNTDDLQIFYEDGVFPASQELQNTLNSMVENDDVAMKQLLQLLKPLGIVQSGSGRLVIDINTISSGTITTVGTVNTVSQVNTVFNQTNIGGLNALDMQFNMARTAWSTLRGNINF
jgi:hypothetical protein